MVSSVVLYRSAKPIHARRLLLALTFVALLAEGCVSASGIPGGPLPKGGGFAINTAIAAPVAVGRADAISWNGRDRGTYSDATADHSLFPMFARAGARLAPASYFDVAADIGWVEAGAEVRVGLPEGTRPFPVALAGGYRAGWEPLFTNRFSPTFGYGRLEAYPLFWSGTEGRRLSAVLTAGISHGDRYHSVTLPRSQFNENGDNIGNPEVEVLRRETRLEATLGVDAHPYRGLLLGFYFMPYRVINESSTLLQVYFEGAQGSTLTRYQQDFGLLLAFTVGYAFHFDQQ
jgi:hypothetical protein